MPMAGEGSRFKDIGINTPKPLIEFNGKPLFVNALETVKNINIASYTFIVRKEHVDNYNIDKEILKYYPDAIIIAIENTTRGAAETAYIAIKNIIIYSIGEFTDGVLIMDCDVVVESNELVDMLKNANTDKFDGLLLSFYSNENKYSYATVNSNGDVISTAEKVVISDNALTSPYYVNKIEDFVDAFHDMETYSYDDELTYKEMYMSILYNFLIANRKTIKLIGTDNILSLGTPEELEEANKQL